MLEGGIGVDNEDHSIVVGRRSNISILPNLLESVKSKQAQQANSRLLRCTNTLFLLHTYSFLFLGSSPEAKGTTSCRT